MDSLLAHREEDRIASRGEVFRDKEEVKMEGVVWALNKLWQLKATFKEAVITVDSADGVVVMGGAGRIKEVPILNVAHGLVTRGIKAKETIMMNNMGTFILNTQRILGLGMREVVITD